MISLSDAELDAVMNAARPLQPQARSEFLRALAAVENQRQFGPGLVHRVARDLQRRYFDPPDLSGVAKYG